MRISDWSSDVCSSDLMVFPYVNMLSYWVYLLSVIVLVIGFFVPGGPTGAGWTLYPPQAITEGTPGYSWGIVTMLVSLAIRSEEHTSELQSLMRISYAVFCLKKKNNLKIKHYKHTTTI